MKRSIEKLTGLRELCSDELDFVSGGTKYKDANGKPVKQKAPEPPPPPPPYFGPGTIITIRF